MKEQIESKLEALEENKTKVVEQIRRGQELVQKGQADLNAILGAIQVCEQLKTERNSLSDEAIEKLETKILAKEKEF